MSRSTVPDVGDIAWLAFSPQVGHEQSGHRPAVVLSPASYDGKTSMMICCPMTSQLKGYPFEVVVTKNLPSAILRDSVSTTRAAFSNLRKI